MARTVRLTGGTRDGETTEVAEDVTRLVAASAAPGLLDVYEESGEDGVFELVDQESAEGIAPEALHMPVMGREGED